MVRTFIQNRMTLLKLRFSVRAIGGALSVGIEPASIYKLQSELLLTIVVAMFSMVI